MNECVSGSGDQHQKEVNFVRAVAPLILMSVGMWVLIPTFEYFEVPVFELLSKLSNNDYLKLI